MMVIGFQLSVLSVSKGFGIEKCLGNSFFTADGLNRNIKISQCIVQRGFFIG